MADLYPEHFDKEYLSINKKINFIKDEYPTIDHILNPENINIDFERFELTGVMTINIYFDRNTKFTYCFNDNSLYINGSNTIKNFYELPFSKKLKYNLLFSLIRIYIKLKGYNS